MKKTIKKSDGVEETIEGTPEEIAEYERKLGRETIKEQRKGRRRLLNEEQVRAIAREEAARIMPCPIVVPYIQPVYPPFNPWGWSITPTLQPPIIPTIWGEATSDGWTVTSTTTEAPCDGNSSNGCNRDGASFSWTGVRAEA